MTGHEFSYPKVTELALVKAVVEHDPFIEDLTSAQKLAQVVAKAVEASDGAAV